MTRNSGISEQEYVISTIPEVQFIPNPSTRSNHRLLTPSLTSIDEQARQENHEYEDPSRLAQQALTGNSRRPRKKDNDLYEPMSMPLKSLNNVKQRVRTLSRSSDDSVTGYTYHGRDPLCHRVILYLVLLLSLTATTLVILMIFGLVGPSCHCGNNQGSSGNTSQGRLSQQFSLSTEPVKKTIEELQANITRLELLLLNKTKTSGNIQVPVVNGSINVVAFERQFDQKLNSTKELLQAADGKIRGEVTAMNNTLLKKIEGVVGGKQGPPGFNGSNGEQGPTGPAGPQGIPGKQGPTGVGNFSKCHYKVESSDTHNQNTISISVNKVQPDGYIILGAACSTLGTREYILEINVPSNGGNPNFVCKCQGKSEYFTSPDSKFYCYLHYFLCPKTT